MSLILPAGTRLILASPSKEVHRNSLHLVSPCTSYAQSKTLCPSIVLTEPMAFAKPIPFFPDSPLEVMFVTPLNPTLLAKLFGMLQPCAEQYVPLKRPTVWAELFDLFNQSFRGGSDADFVAATISYNLALEPPLEQVLNSMIPFFTMAFGFMDALEQDTANAFMTSVKRVQRAQADRQSHMVT